MVINTSGVGLHQLKISFTVCTGSAATTVLCQPRVVVFFWALLFDRFSVLPLVLADGHVPFTVVDVVIRFIDHESARLSSTAPVFIMGSSTAPVFIMGVLP